MGTPSKKANRERLFPAEIVISLQKLRPSTVFQWLTASLRRLTQSTWNNVFRPCLMSDMIGIREKTLPYWRDNEPVIRSDGGDIRKLRKAAGHHPDQERHWLKECKGKGSIGVDIFFREIQMSGRNYFPLSISRPGRAQKS